MPNFFSDRNPLIFNHSNQCFEQQHNTINRFKTSWNIHNSRYWVGILCSSHIWIIKYIFTGINLMENMYCVSHYRYESCLQSQFLVDPLLKKTGCYSFYYGFKSLFPTSFSILLFIMVQQINFKLYVLHHDDAIQTVRFHADP